MLSNKPSATAASLRAVLDHIPPLLAQRTWDDVASSYKWERTNKKYVDQLHDSRAISDDSLHRAIGKKNLAEIDMTDIPPKRNLEILLEECLDADLTKLEERNKEVSAKPSTVNNQAKTTPQVTLSNGLKWANWGGLSAGFMTQLKINNFGGSEDYLTEVSVHAINDQGDDWAAELFQFFEVDGENGQKIKLEPNVELYVGENKIVNTRLFITDELTPSRLMPDLDLDTVVASFNFSSGKVISVNLKPGEVTKS